MPKSTNKTQNKKRTTEPNQSTNFINQKVEKVRSFLNRRPHRSFKLSRKVDYVRPLEIEGYFKFSQIVFDRNGYQYHGVIAAFGDALRANEIKF